MDHFNIHKYQIVEVSFSQSNIKFHIQNEMISYRMTQNSFKTFELSIEIDLRSSEVVKLMKRKYFTVKKRRRRHLCYATRLERL